MFCDLAHVEDMIPPALSAAWETSVRKCLKMNQQARVVVVEIGCGANVTTVRCHSERFLESCASVAPGRCTLIRYSLQTKKKEFHLMKLILIELTLITHYKIDQIWKEFKLSL